jgi:hypothetical protein
MARFYSFSKRFCIDLYMYHYYIRRAVYCIVVGKSTSRTKCSQSQLGCARLTKTIETFENTFANYASMRFPASDD